MQTRESLWDHWVWVVACALMAASGCVAGQDQGSAPEASPEGSPDTGWADDVAPNNEGAPDAEEDSGAGLGDALVGETPDVPGEDAPDEPDPPREGAQPGSLCGCDSDCASEGGQSGVCVTGICMLQATGACEFRGSSGECPDGSRCWPLRNFGDSPVCWPDCAAHDCDGTCDEDGSCAPDDGMDCDAACGQFCNGDGRDYLCDEAHTNGRCPEGEFCNEGTCTLVCDGDNPDGYCPNGFVCEGGACIPTEGCGDWRCDLGGACDDIIAMPGSTDPMSPEAVAAGYYIDTHPDYAFLRRDLVFLVQWAGCRMRARFEDIGPLGLADLTQSNGRIPGTDVGDARHPDNTHDGSDLDIAYYQTDGLNDAQIICGDGSDTNGNGTRGQHNDGYFCTTEANIVDMEQQVFFMSLMAQHPGWRIVGVDETLADDIEAEIERLFDAGLIDDDVRDNLYSLGYGSGGGWAFHHHHIHISYYD